MRRETVDPFGVWTSEPPHAAPTGGGSTGATAVAFEVAVAAERGVRFVIAAAAPTDAPLWRVEWSGEAAEDRHASEVVAARLTGAGQAVETAGARLERAMARLAAGPSYAVDDEQPMAEARLGQLLEASAAAEARRGQPREASAAAETPWGQLHEASVAAETRAGLRREAAMTPDTLAFAATGSGEPTVWAHLADEFRLGLARAGRLLADPAWVASTRAGRPCGRTLLGWSGIQTSLWPAALGADDVMVHQRSVEAAIRTRTAFLQMVTLIARAATLLAAASTPLGMLALPAAWRFVHDVLQEQRS